jgi:chemotaxis response regulator CheB
MPKAVVDLGIADEVLPVDEIANAIVSAIKRNQ